MVQFFFYAIHTCIQSVHAFIKTIQAFIKAIHLMINGAELDIIHHTHQGQEADDEYSNSEYRGYFL